MNHLTCVHFSEVTISNISAEAASKHTVLNVMKKNCAKLIWAVQTESEWYRLNAALSGFLWEGNAAQLIVCASSSSQDATGNQMESRSPATPSILQEEQQLQKSLTYDTEKKQQNAKASKGVIQRLWLCHRY